MVAGERFVSRHAKCLSQSGFYLHAKLAIFLERICPGWSRNPHGQQWPLSIERVMNWKWLYSLSPSSSSSRLVSRDAVALFGLPIPINCFTDSYIVIRCRGGVGGEWCVCLGQPSRNGSKLGSKMNILNEKFDVRPQQILNYWAE